MPALRALAILTLLVSAAPAFAQETTGDLRGTVVDAQGLVVPGATVTATGPQGARTSVTQVDGRFSLPFLTPGSYDVRAEQRGFRTFEQKNVAVDLGRTVSLMIRMDVGGVTENVSVTQGAPTIDAGSTTIGSVMSSDFLESVPVGRRLADTLYLSPGVSSSNTVGRMNPSISGGSGLDNQYVIDGVNVTSPGYGGLGSFSSIFRSLGNSTPFDFINEVQVKTGGYEAEFGQSIGGVVNVVTKSGTNDVGGSAFAYSRPKSLEGDWTQVQTPNGTVQTIGSHSYDAGAAAGGPIVKNRLFFFGAIDPSREVQTFQAPQGFPLESLGGVDRVRDARSYSAKATYELSGHGRIVVSLFGDPSNGLDGAQRPGALLATTTSQYSALKWGGHNQTVRYEGALSSNWLIEGSYAHALNSFAEMPDANTWQYRDQTVVPNVRSGGIGAFEPGNRGIDNQYSVKSTNVFRGHELKYGFEYDRAEWDQLESYTGPTFVAPNGLQTTSGAIIRIVADPSLGQIYRVSNAFLLSGARTTQRYQSGFVQDSWRIGSRLTVNPGIRFEHEALDGNVISDWSLGNNVAARVGAAFDATGDGKTKVFGSWGRFYARVPNDLAARVLSGETIITKSDYYDAGLTNAIPAGVLAGGTTNHFALLGGSAGDTVDPNAKLPYVNELVIGIDREVMRSTSLSVRYIYRNLGRIVEDVGNCPIAGVFLAATASACGSVTDVLMNPTSATPINPAAVAAYPAFAAVSFADPERRYQAVEATLNRRLSNNWSGIAWYRWSRLRGNYEGFYRDDTGQADPGASTLYDFPQNDPTFASVGQSLGFQGDIRYQGDPNGILPLDRPNQFRLLGNYTHNELNLAVGLSGSSGAPLTPLAPNPVPGYTGGEIPTAPRGSGIQTVDGFMTRTPFTTQVDFQVAYRLPINALRLTLVADVFNLFNQQTVQAYDTWTALAFGGPPNPNFGYPTSSALNVAGPQLQAPRQIRLGARLTF